MFAADAAFTVWIKLLIMISQADTIGQLLTETKTIAVVGLSSNRLRAGYYVPQYLQQAGYRIMPVNPTLTDDIFGETVYPDLESVPEPVDLVLVFRRPEYVPDIVDSAIQIGAKGVWMQLGIAHAAAAEKAHRAGLQVVMNACMMVEHKHWK